MDKEKGLGSKYKSKEFDTITRVKVERSVISRKTRNSYKRRTDKEGTESSVLVTYGGTAV